MMNLRESAEAIHFDLEQPVRMAERFSMPDERGLLTATRIETEFVVPTSPIQAGYL